MGKLNGKVAVITGAARGQGEATARLFAEEGARVAVVDLLPEGAKVAADIGPNAFYANFDVSDQAAWQDFSVDILGHWGRVDILVNNAAIVHAAGLLDLETEDFRRVLDVNLLGAWNGIRTLGAHMAAQGSGSIVNVHSIGALIGLNGLGAYVASKWALRGLSKTAALELAHRGVRVNGIFPGAIASPMAGLEEEPPEVTAQRFVGQPIARIGEPLEVAKASLFLASDDSSFMCGAELVIDGGMTVGKYYNYLPGAPDVPLAPTELAGAPSWGR